MKHDPKTKHQHYCHTCNNTGLCQSCEGRGCMDCNYTGMCHHCQNVNDSITTSIPPSGHRVTSSGHHGRQR